MVSKVTVVLDACILYPAPLRDLFMHLALNDLFRAKWTEDIHEEWIRNVLENRPDLKRRQLERTRKLMDSNVRDCLVIGYQKIIHNLELPDENDRHVLVAAIKSKSDGIVTFNLKDFPKKHMGNYGLKVFHPDDFLVNLIESDPNKVYSSVKNQRLSLRNPSKNQAEYLENMGKQSIPKAIKIFQNNFSLI